MVSVPRVEPGDQVYCALLLLAAGWNGVSLITLRRALRLGARC